MSGWAFPNNNGNAKCHFFMEDALLSPSLCGKWGYSGHPLQGGADAEPSKDDCVSCTKKLTKLKEQERI